MKRLKDKLFTYWRAFTEWAAGVIEKGKKKQTGTLGWLKTTGFLLLAVAAFLVVVGLISAFVVFCVALPGLIFGTILWVAWTWAGLGSLLFPALDPYYLNLPYSAFFWSAIVVYWVVKMFRKGKQPPLLNNRDS